MKSKYRMATHKHPTRRIDNHDTMAEIAEIEKQITVTEIILVEKIEEFIAEVAISIQEQSVEIVKKIGRSQPDISEKLGKSGIDILMKEVKDYKTAIPENCRKCLCQPSAWRIFADKEPQKSSTHIRPSFLVAGLSTDIINNKIFSNILNHIYDALTPLGRMLARSGYETDKDETYAIHQKVCFSINY